MDELIDVLDAKGVSTGKTKLKSHAHRMGLFHAAVHIWFYTLDGKVLLQQRGEHKDTYPLLWDVSVAGHVGTGETIEIAALREVEEEIGLTILESDLEKIGVFKTIQKHSEDLIDCEFHHTFICKLNTPFNKLQKQESEVEALKLILLPEFSNGMLNRETQNSFVPRNKNYYKTIITAIQERL